ncbi:STAS domain-containing protein [Lusitaniella coriacea LEGE 07157]|uniref:Anti-sigma factor antagonist n=1 Tax=Lusitaniella coriacea LEGE 07157 TaxID=945747 RepID=A0A8J7DWV1_9CYAN|nr:STAS domain-containing protein [Lusitaniella coriacea]MBE9116345.1 STAS domain-containing protein [Lusitaniella coriacea LEGE 07157]
MRISRYTKALTCKRYIQFEEEIIPEPLTLTVSLRGTREIKENCQIFRLTGLLDAFSEPTFRRVISNYIDEGPPNIILALSQIDFVDSSGLGALVQLVKKAQTAGGTLQIVTNPRVTQTVKLVRLEKFLSLQPSVEDALTNLESS